MIQVSDIRPSWVSCIFFFFFFFFFVMTCISIIICSTADIKLSKVVCCSLCNLSIFLLKSSKLRLICWICLLWILSTSFNAFVFLSLNYLFFHAEIYLYVLHILVIFLYHVKTSVRLWQYWNLYKSLEQILCYMLYVTTQNKLHKPGKKMITTTLVFSVLLVLAT